MHARNARAVLLHRDRYHRTAWKNGGGVTADIVVDGAPQAPLRRLSLATIAQDGPFSDFTGYDRTLILAGGDGIVLQVGARTAALRETGARCDFSGDERVTCALLGGPATAFNVIARRDAYRAHVRVDDVPAGAAWRPAADAAYVFAIAGTLETPNGALHAHDTLRLDGAADALRARTACRLVSVGFSAAQANVVRGFPSA